MARQIFKGFMQVTEGTFSAENGYIYFVRKTSNTGSTDGYLQFNGKKYGTAAELAEEINAKIGTLPEGYSDVVSYIEAQASASTDTFVTKTSFESYTAATDSRLDTIESGYTQKSVYDAYTAATDNTIGTLSGRVDALEAVSADTRLEALETSAHTHENKSVLDGITAEKVSAWDSIAGGAEVVISAYTGSDAGLTEGMLKSYEVFQGGVSKGKIDIPKDLVVTSGTVTTNSQGEKVLRLTIANQDTPVDILVSDLAHVYSDGDGIEISESDVVSAKVVAANGLSVGSNGIALALADASNNGAMSASDFEKLATIDASAQTNVIETVKVNGTALTPDGNKAVDVVLPSATVSGESNGFEVEVTQTDGEITNVSVTAPEVASQSDFEALSGTVKTIEDDYLSNGDFHSYTATTNSRLDALEAVSADTRLDTIESGYTQKSVYDTYTAATDSRLDAIESVSADTRLDALEALTGDTSSALQSISAGDASVSVGTKTNNDQTVAVAISSSSDNALSLNNDGLFAAIYYDGDDVPSV